MECSINNDNPVKVKEWKLCTAKNILFSHKSGRQLGMDAVTQGNMVHCLAAPHS
jgi:hypothetical protein